MDIDGRAVIVTGGASGLGRATMDLLAASGAKVAIFDLNRARAEEVAAEADGEVSAHEVNVLDEASVTAGLDEVAKRHGAVHACVNCAGGGDAARTVGRDGPYPLDRFRGIVELNIIGTFNMVRLAAARMGDNEPLTEDGERGAIVNVGSVAGIDGQIGQAAYAAGKAGVIGMTLPIARDLARMGVRVNTICPGVFMTEMVAMAPQEMIDALAAHAQFPARLGKPEEFAKLALALIENGYINGEVVRLDAAARLPPK